MARKKAAPVNRTVECDTWHYPIYLYFVPDEESWQLEMERIAEEFPEYDEELRDHPFPGSAGHTFTVRPENDLYRIFVTLGPDFRDNPIAVPVMLCHEAVHVYQWLRGAIKEAPPEDAGSVGTEWEAYTIHQIFQELLTAYWRSHA